jgi:WD40 repeat protein
VLILTGVYILWSTELSNAQKTKLERSDELASQAVSLSEENPLLALTKAEEAFNTAPTDEAILALRTTLAKPPPGKLITPSFSPKNLTNGVLTYSPDGKTVAIAEKSGTIQLWDTLSRTKKQELKGETLIPNGLTFSPDGRYLAGKATKEVFIWYIAKGSRLTTLPVENGATASFAFSGDSRYGIAGGNGTDVYIWDLMSGQIIQRLRGHARPVISAEFDPKGERVLTVDNGIAKIWNRVSGEELFTIRDGNGIIKKAVFGGDGQLVLTLGSELRIWAASSGKLMASIRLPQILGSNANNDATQLTVRDSQILVVSSQGEAFVYNCLYCGDTNSLMEEVKRRLKK